MLRWFKSLLPGLVLLLALGTAIYFVRTRPETPRSEQVTLGTPVEGVRAVRGNHSRRIQTNGQVEAERILTIRTEVGGRIVQRSPRLREGQLVKRGETLFALDNREAESALREAEAGVAQAKVALKEEEARAVVAGREWAARERVGGASPARAEGAPASAEVVLQELALRAPYLASARARLEAAVAAVGRAKLNLERCHIVAPFEALVLSTDVEIGRVVAPGESLARVASIDAFWVRATLPMGAVAHVRFPRDGATPERMPSEVLLGPGPRRPAKRDAHLVREDEEGPSRADVWFSVGGARQRFYGSALRLSGELAPGSRMAQLIVRVPEPLTQTTATIASRESGANPKPSRGVQAETRLPLLLGTFVHVELEAGELVGVFELPRSALRERDQLFVASAEGRLEFRTATVPWRTPEHIYVSRGLEDGDVVVVSTLASPLPGMPLRLVHNGEAKAVPATEVAPEEDSVAPVPALEGEPSPNAAPGGAD